MEKNTKLNFSSLVSFLYLLSLLAVWLTELTLTAGSGCGERTNEINSLFPPEGVPSVSCPSRTQSVQRRWCCWQPAALLAARSFLMNTRAELWRETDGGAEVVPVVDRAALLLCQYADVCAGV